MVTWAPADNIVFYYLSASLSAHCMSDRMVNHASSALTQGTWCVVNYLVGHVQHALNNATVCCHQVKSVVVVVIFFNRNYQIGSNWIIWLRETVKPLWQFTHKCAVTLRSWRVFQLSVMCFVGISGFVSSSMFMKMSGERWVANVNLTSALFTCK